MSDLAMRYGPTEYFLDKNANLHGQGPVRSVIRAVPIAVLKPMIGASEAVSKTLLGLHNTLDPNVRIENEGNTPVASSLPGKVG